MYHKKCKEYYWLIKKKGKTRNMHETCWEVFSEASRMHPEAGETQDWHVTVIRFAETVWEIILSVKAK